MIGVYSGLFLSILIFLTFEVGNIKIDKVAVKFSIERNKVNEAIISQKED